MSRLAGLVVLGLLVLAGCADYPYPDTRAPDGTGPQTAAPRSFVTSRPSGEPSTPAKPSIRPLRRYPAGPELTGTGVTFSGQLVPLYGNDGVLQCVGLLTSRGAYTVVGSENRYEVQFSTAVGVPVDRALTGIRWHGAPSNQMLASIGRSVTIVGDPYDGQTDESCSGYFAIGLTRLVSVR